MARMTKESLEEKIKKAEEKVIKTGDAYNKACDELNELRNKMAAIEGEALVSAFTKSNKTIDEVITFLESDMKSERESSSKGRRCGRRTKTDENHSEEL